jgi:hypothetical protein
MSFPDVRHGESEVLDAGGASVEERHEDRDRTAHGELAEDRSQGASVRREAVRARALEVLGDARPFARGEAGGIQTVSRRFSR